MRNLTPETQIWVAERRRIIGLRPHGLGEGGPDRSAQTAVRSSTPGTSPSPPHWDLPGAGTSAPIRSQLGGSGSGAPLFTPLSGRDPRPPQTAQIRPKTAEFFRFFGGLWCNAQGGWGGSAHYPDPTAQSVDRARRKTRHRSRPRRTLSGRSDHASRLG